MTTISPQIHESWKAVLNEEFNAPYFSDLKEFLVKEKTKHTIFPPGNLIFNAFNNTPFDNVKVVILGQDPYHGDGQAHGLCFSVPHGIKKPPSLVNIYKELNSDIGFTIPEHGNLESWTKQGVLLINATLTVRAHEAGSHQNKGWEQFTDSVIQKISSEKENVIFILWGNYAKAKENLIDTAKHHILKAAHPSPFSAYNGFLGCKHFSQTNSLLKEMGNEKVDWQV